MLGKSVAIASRISSFKTISSSIPAYIGQRFEIPCEDVGRVMRLCISGFALVSAGMGVAPMTISPFARWLISTYDWRIAMLTTALLVRRPPAVAAIVRPGTAGEGSGISAAQALRSPQFLVSRSHVLRVLCGALRTDLSHGELRHLLRRARDGSG